MVNVEYINPGIPVAGPYTPVIKAGNLIFISGQIADKDVKEIGKQTNNILEKIKHLLEVSNASIKNLVKITVYLANIEDFQKMNEGYKAFFINNNIKDKFPTRTTVQARPPLISIDIEIDAIAVI
jgi:2-iminobutanoate/2-iminopropanoate deaminase